MKGYNLSRRNFLYRSGKIFGGSLAALSLTPTLKNIYAWTSKKIQTDYLDELIRTAPLAKYWLASNSKNVNCASCHSSDQNEKRTQFDHDDKLVKCLLCAQACIIKSGNHGTCRARMNIDGKLKSLVYGRPISIHIDPIEKKPFYHFLPGADAYSMATAGCPLSCKFCQNWQISQAHPEDFYADYISPNKIVDDSKSNNAAVIAFTYNEPTVFYEYMIDIAEQAKKKNIRTVMISCGFMNHEPLNDLCDVLDAIKIDLKGFSEEFYRKVCSAELKPVLRTIKQIAKSKTHIEIVNLVVPTLNDSDKMLNELSNWIVNEIGNDVPIHFTRFHPDYKLLNLSPTPISTLEKARSIAMSKGIHYAFVGNVPGHDGNCTYCPNCKKIIIKRSGMFTSEVHLNNGRCEYCRTTIAGVWK